MYWADAPDVPAKVRQMKSKAEPGGRSLWIHCRERFQNAGGYLQYKPFMRQVDHNFVLQAEGRVGRGVPSVHELHHVEH